MTANSLTYRTLYAATVLWGAPSPEHPVATDKRTWLASRSEVAPWLPEIDEDRATLGRAPAEGSPYAVLSNRIEDLDGVHDRGGSFVVGLLRLYEALGGDLGEIAKELLLTLFPTGANFINESILGQETHGTVRAAQLSADVRAKLSRFPVASTDGTARTLLDEVLALNAVGVTLADVWRERAALGSDGTVASATDLIAAKRRLITTVREILASLERLAKVRVGGLDETGRIKLKELRQVWDSAVATATANAAARSAAATAGTTTAAAATAPAASGAAAASPPGSGTPPAGSGEGH